MTLIEAAELLGLNPGTLRRQIALGKLDAAKVGRDWHVTEAEVARYRATSLGTRKGVVITESELRALYGDR